MKKEDKNGHINHLPDIYPGLRPWMHNRLQSWNLQGKRRNIKCQDILLGLVLYAEKLSPGPQYPDEVCPALIISVLMEFGQVGF